MTGQFHDQAAARKFIRPQVNLTARSDLHRRRELPAERFKIGPRHLFKDAVARCRATETATTCDLSSNSPATCAGILTIASPQCVVNFLVGLPGRDGDCSSIAVAGLALEAGGLATAVVVDV